MMKYMECVSLEAASGREWSWLAGLSIRKSESSVIEGNE
jgi:hypothetical protein